MSGHRTVGVLAMHAEAAGPCGTQRPAPEGIGSLWCIMLRRCVRSARLFVPPRLRGTQRQRRSDEAPDGRSGPVCSGRGFP